jgi:hypothetical protein
MAARAPSVGGLTIDYGSSGVLTVVSITNDPDGIFAWTLGETIDTGTQVRNLNGLNPFGPVLGNIRLGSIVFHNQGFQTVLIHGIYTATDAIEDNNQPGVLIPPESLGTAELVNLHDPPTPSPPTATPPTATPPPPTPTPDPQSCVGMNPVTTVNTIGNGQSPTNNNKVTHEITGNIIDPGSLKATASRIPVCAGSSVTATVSDSTGVPTNSPGGSLVCNPVTSQCTGVVNVTEKYTSVSADGKDTDRVAILPK